MFILLQVVAALATIAVGLAISGFRGSDPSHERRLKSVLGVLVAIVLVLAAFGPRKGRNSLPELPVTQIDADDDLVCSLAVQDELAICEATVDEAVGAESPVDVLKQYQSKKSPSAVDAAKHRDWATKRWSRGQAAFDHILLLGRLVALNNHGDNQ